MAKRCSADLRERVVAFIQAGILDARRRVISVSARVLRLS